MLELDGAAWAEAQWGSLQLGDARRTRRAVEVGKALVAQPDASLPQQLGSWAALVAGYRLLNNPQLSLADLAGDHWRQTRAATTAALVLMIQDTTELDYTHQPTKRGLGPIGDGRGRGRLLHTTLSVVPAAVPQVLGVAYQKTVLRTPRPKGVKYASSPESLLWHDSAWAVGSPPPGTRWVHLGDRLADDFRFWDACRQTQCDFLVRLCRNRWLAEPAAADSPTTKLLDYLRAQPSQATRTLHLPARDKLPARAVELHLSWDQCVVPPSAQAPREVRCRPPLTVQVVRVWEEPTAESPAEPIEWCLATSLAVECAADAWQIVEYYTCRWLIEDYHQCLKSGTKIEQRELDDGADIDRLLGFCGPIAARLLALRQWARQAPDAPVAQEVEPLLLALLATQVPRLPEPAALTRQQFCRAVAQLGGYLGRTRDGPPGWQTLWRGWHRLSTLLEGARLAAALRPP